MKAESLQERVPAQTHDSGGAGGTMQLTVGLSAPRLQDSAGLELPQAVRAPDGLASARPTDPVKRRLVRQEASLKSFLPAIAHLSWLE